jgi:FtsH-binding integral membrane protein
MDNEIESNEPLLNPPKKSFKRKERLHGTVAYEPSFSKNLSKLYSEKDPKLEKEKNKFLFKVYLHLLCQSIFIFIMLIFAFRFTFFTTLLIENNIIFYASLIILLIAFIQPLISDQILKNKPQNYIYLSIFTLCISYILCKEAVLFDFYLIMIMSLLNIIEILYLTIESYIVKKNEKTEMEIANTATFMGLVILFIGSILCFLKKISIFKFSVVLLILIVLGVYIIYDMNCIFIDKRRVFKDDEFVLATVFVYIDIFQTILELLEKFYNSCEPERKPVKKKTTKRGMIFTGEDDYKKQYRKESDEKDKKSNDDENANKHHRRLSSSDLKRNLTFMEKNPILEDINEEKDEEIEIKDNENLENDDFSEDKEGNLSFKKKNDYLLKMNEEEEKEDNDQ